MPEDGAFLLAKGRAEWQRDVTFAWSKVGAHVTILRKFLFYCGYKGIEIKLLIHGMPGKKTVLQEMLSYFNVWKHTIEKSWFFPCPPTELIKSENIPKLNSLCQKVPLLFWVSHESYAAWAAQWDPVWLALFLGYRGMSIPQREWASHRGAESHRRVNIPQRIRIPQREWASCCWTAMAPSSTMGLGFGSGALGLNWCVC